MPHDALLALLVDRVWLGRAGTRCLARAVVTHAASSLTVNVQAHVSVDFAGLVRGGVIAMISWLIARPRSHTLAAREAACTEVPEATRWLSAHGPAYGLADYEVRAG